MVDYQKGSHCQTGNGSASQISWKDHEMQALTDVFREVVRYNCGAARKPRPQTTKALNLHPSNWSSGLSARNELCKPVNDDRNLFGYCEALPESKPASHHEHSILLQPQHPSNCTLFANPREVPVEVVEDLQVQNRVLALQVQVLQHEMLRIKRQMMHGESASNRSYRSCSSHHRRRENQTRPSTQLNFKPKLDLIAD